MQPIELSVKGLYRPAERTKHLKPHFHRDLFPKECSFIGEEKDRDAESRYPRPYGLRFSLDRHIAGMCPQRPCSLHPRSGPSRHGTALRPERTPIDTHALPVGAPAHRIPRGVTQTATPVTHISSFTSYSSLG